MRLSAGSRETTGKEQEAVATASCVELWGGVFG